VLQVELLVVRGLSGRQIEMLKREADVIWEGQDVKIEWAGDGMASSVRVMIRQEEEQWRVAGTRVIDGRVTPPIYVSLDAAERVVRATVSRSPTTVAASSGLSPRV
jgi:hypothetical protein